MNKSAILLIFLILGLSTTPAMALEGRSVIERVVNIFSVWTGDEPSPAIFDEAAGLIDYREMSRRSMGTYWSDLTEVQKREFVFVFRKLVEDRYYERWHKIFSKGKLDVIKEVAIKDSIYVRSTLTVGDKSDVVVWRLTKSRDGALRVISLAVDEKDLLARIGKRFRRYMRRDGFEDLLDWMMDRADIDEDNAELKAIRSTASK